VHDVQGGLAFHGYTADLSRGPERGLDYRDIGGRWHRHCAHGNAVAV